MRKTAKGSLVIIATVMVLQNMGYPVGSLLAEAGTDLRRGTPTTWGGRSYLRESR